MEDFFIYMDRIEVVLQGKMLTIYFTKDSGKVFYRWKINTVFGVKHPGICIGVDDSNQYWFIHNHFENGKPSIATQDIFSKGKPIYLSEEPCANTPLQIIANGLRQVKEGRAYNGLLYNCQSFVNNARNNNNVSEAVGGIIGGLFLTALVIAGAKAIRNSK